MKIESLPNKRAEEMGLEIIVIAFQSREGRKMEGRHFSVLYFPNFIVRGKIENHRNKA